ncbi:CinA family protein [Streptomyces sp. NPDC057702]|uniref:CinA family protein n=1 Tax=unclassified Streptomyces TaxID=2593676 RepID=UPI00367F6FED
MDGPRPAVPAAEVLATLAARGQSVAVAESLTGGLLAAALTEVPGASRCFRGAITAYATEVKAAVLGVDAGLLAARGAVDAEVAAQMARGVRRVVGADWALATTGVAGPTPQDGQPVGTVHIAVAGPDGASAARCLGLAGTRAEIRARSVTSALELLQSELIENARAQDTEQGGGI